MSSRNCDSGYRKIVHRLWFPRVEKGKQMPNNVRDSLQELIQQVTTDNSLSADQKVKFLESLQKLSNPLQSALQSDRLVYRMVVSFLGVAVVLTIVGGFYLSITTAATIPEGLIALGSAAVGALAGLLAPSPTTK